jgi:hypothetical protein
MAKRKNEPEIVAYGYVIADHEGLVQLQTLRSNASEAWAALLGRKTSRSDRARYRRMGFLSVPVFVRNFFK